MNKKKVISIVVGILVVVTLFAGLFLHNVQYYGLEYYLHNFLDVARRLYWEEFYYTDLMVYFSLALIIIQLAVSITRVDVDNIKSC